MRQFLSLAEKIPGYGGYLKREARRNSDKELRMAVAAGFASQVNRIQRLQEQMLKRGDLHALEELERIITRLQHLVDRIRTASYGFTGLFDANRVDEEVLDNLYAFDSSLTEGVEETGDLITQIGATPQDQGRIGDLRDKIDELHRTFDQRVYVIKNVSSLGHAPTTEVPVYE